MCHASTTAPTPTRTGTQAFGIYICDTFQPKITGTLEETGVDSQGNTVLLNDKFKILGVHSHDDGIIHYHPASTKSSGNRAKLGVFLDSYNIKLTDTELVMPPEQGGDKWSTENTKCDGKDTQLITSVWDHYNDPNTFHDVVTDIKNIRITNDGMVFTVAFVPKGTDIPQPDWAAQLPTLGAADGGCRDRQHHHVGPRSDGSTAVNGHRHHGALDHNTTGG